MPSISVIIPAYNRAPLIGSTLLSILNQTLPAFEIIVVDDGSTDDTIEVVRITYEKWKQDNCSNQTPVPRLIILEQTNKGAGAARNLGYRHAHGEFIHFFDSDDLASENKHEVQHAALKRENADIIFSPWVKFSSNESITKPIEYVLQQELPDSHQSLLSWWLRGWSTVLQSLLFRKSFLDKLSLFREDMPSHQDSEFMTRVLLANPKVAFAPDALTLYRVHKFGNITPLNEERKAGRFRDKAKFLVLGNAEIDNSAQKVDLLSLFINRFNIYKAHKELIDEYDPEIIRLTASLKLILSGWPAWTFKYYKIIDRIVTRLRFETRGTRYISAMKASMPNSVQQKIITELILRYSCAESLYSGISVIIPVYNRSSLIAQTLISILNQTIQAEEIIIVDDGSTDETAKAAQSAFAEWESGKVKDQKSPVFKVIRQENAGPSKARNTGFAASKGEFIHFFDSDDLAAPNKHEVQVRALQNSGVDISYSPWVKGRINGVKVTLENSVLQQRGLPADNNLDLIKNLLCDWSIVMHTCLFRRSILEKSRGFPEYLRFAEDQKMFINLLLVGAKCVHTPETLELYRTNDINKITSNWQKEHAVDWAKFLIGAHDECKRHGINPSRCFKFRRRLWEALEDIRKVGVDTPDLILTIKSIMGCNTPYYFYKIHRGIERKWLGFKSRITGARANSSFKSGPITKKQKQLIEQMGLHLEESCASNA